MKTLEFRGVVVELITQRKFHTLWKLWNLEEVLLFNSLHKGNIYTLWKLWNLEEVGIMTGFAN